MDRRARFRLELRAVVVSFKAALRSVRSDHDDERAGAAERRALDLLDSVAERYDDLSADADGRSDLDAARRTVRTRDVSIVTHGEGGT
jgi:hypothetical protein